MVWYDQTVSIHHHHDCEDNPQLSNLAHNEDRTRTRNNYLRGKKRSEGGYRQTGSRSTINTRSPSSAKRTYRGRELIWRFCLPQPLPLSPLQLVSFAVKPLYWRIFNGRACLPLFSSFVTTTSQSNSLVFGRLNWVINFLLQNHSTSWRTPIR